MKAIAVPAQPGRSGYDAHLVDEQHRLRARVFKDRLGWDVTTTDKGEADDFDLLGPTYILALLDDGRLAGCARLLPALGPIMLTRIFPSLVPEGDGFHAHAAMIESSRFCVDTRLDQSGRGGLIHEATATLFCAILEWCIGHGYREIVTVTDLRFERILSRVDWPLQRIGEPRRVGSTVAVAGILPADGDIFARLRPAGYVSAIPTRRQAA